MKYGTSATVLLSFLLQLASGLSVGKAHSRQVSKNGRQVCHFASFRNSFDVLEQVQEQATTDNVVFQSHVVLVVEDNSYRNMVFLHQGGQDGHEKEPYCHEQAAVNCGFKSQDNSFLQDANATGACAGHQHCIPDAVPPLSYIRSMIGGAISLHTGELGRVASIGLGAGSIPLWFARSLPSVQVDAIDISADVISAAPCFGVESSPTLRLIEEDGAKYLREQNDGTYDIVFIDAFDDLDNIPEPLKSKEFFEMVGRKLTPGGVLAMNVWHQEVGSVAHTLKEAYPGQDRVRMGLSPGLGNRILLVGGEQLSWTDKPIMEETTLSIPLRWAGEAQIRPVGGVETFM